MMKGLFLDDIRNPKDCTYVPNSQKEFYLYDEVKWNIVRDYNSFCEYIVKNEIPEIISFDHDLADEHYRQSIYNPDKHYSKYYTDGTFKEKTGYDCAKFLVDYLIDNNLKMPIIFVHSMNPIGKENIIQLFYKL